MNVFQIFSRSVIVAPLCVLLACASKPQTARPSVDYIRQSRQKYSDFKKRQAEKDTERERALVLEMKGTGRALNKEDWISPDTDLDKSVPKKVSTVTTPVTHDKPSAADALSAASGEHLLYSNIIATYRTRDMAELEKTLALLLKTYPDSVFADNALYLAGLLAFESNDYKTALRYMDRVMSEFPAGNKAVSALFARAEIEKRERHFAQAKVLLLKVREMFPGSPEAMRASTELKLIDPSAKNHREL